MVNGFGINLGSQSRIATGSSQPQRWDSGILGSGITKNRLYKKRGEIV